MIGVLILPISRWRQFKRIFRQMAIQVVLLCLATESRWQPEGRGQKYDDNTYIILLTSTFIVINCTRRNVIRASRRNFLKHVLQPLQHSWAHEDWLMMRRKTTECLCRRIQKKKKKKCKQTEQMCAISSVHNVLHRWKLILFQNNILICISSDLNTVFPIVGRKHFTAQRK